MKLTESNFGIAISIVAIIAFGIFVFNHFKNLNIYSQINTGASTSYEEESHVATYQVVKGDTLWSIAIKVYGDGYRWPEIAKANKLQNPNLIHSGNIFVIPN